MKTLQEILLQEVREAREHMLRARQVYLTDDFLRKAIRDADDKLGDLYEVISRIPRAIPGDPLSVKVTAP